MDSTWRQSQVSEGATIAPSCSKEQLRRKDGHPKWYNKKPSRDLHPRARPHLDLFGDWRGRPEV